MAIADRINRFYHTCATTLDDEECAELEALAAEKGWSISQVLRACLLLGLARPSEVKAPPSRKPERAIRAKRRPRVTSDAVA